MAVCWLIVKWNRAGFALGEWTKNRLPDSLRLDNESLFLKDNRCRPYPASDRFPSHIAYHCKPLQVTAIVAASRHFLSQKNRRALATTAFHL